MKNVIEKLIKTKTMNNKYLTIFVSILMISFYACDKEETPEPQNNDILGCTNIEALNYNPNANIDDGTCIILGCTDENAQTLTLKQQMMIILVNTQLAQCLMVIGI